MDPTASNYLPDATIPGECKYIIIEPEKKLYCDHSKATNFDSGGVKC